VVGPLLYLLFTANLPTSSETTSATFTDDTEVLAVDNNQATTSSKLQSSLLAIQNWHIKWRVEANKFKFTTSHSPHIEKCVPQAQDIKYQGLHLDRRLTWREHIFLKCKQLGITLTRMHWLRGHKSKLSTKNKILIYKTILKPIWTYDIQPWGTTSISDRNS
jgi:hypothetical protein